MGYTYFVKPNFGNYSINCTFDIYISGSWQSRSNNEVISTAESQTRTCRLIATSLPTGKQLIDFEDFLFYRTSSPVNLGSSYYTAVERVQANYTQLTFAQFASYLSLTDTRVSTSEIQASYVTPNDGYTYAMIFPETNNDYFETLPITYYSVTTSLTDCTCNITSGTTYASGTQITITVTPNTGYSLTSAPSLSGMSATWTQSGTAWTTTINITADITVSATATIVQIYYNINKTLSNCTVSPNDSQILEGNTITFTIIPDNGYELFSNPPSVYYNSSYHYPSAIGQGSYDFTLTTTEIYSDILINASAQIAPVATTVITSLSNMDLSSPTTAQVPFNQATTFIVTKRNHYSNVTSVPAVDGNTMSLIDNEYRYTAYPHFSTITVSGVATEDWNITLSFDLTNCTANYTDTDKFYLNDYIDLILTADTGLYFQNPPTVVYFTRWGTQVVDTLIPVTGATYETGYQWGYTLSDTISNVVVRGTCQAIPILDDFGVFNIYNPTLSNLNDIANMRYSFSEDNTYYFKDVDLGQFMLSLMRVYMPLTHLTSNVEIVLGGYQTGVSCPAINYPYESVDCGEIVVQGHFNDARDYQFADYRLYLPFYGFYAIDANVVVGKTLNIVYTMELITGNAIISITSDDELVDNLKCKCATDIPYLLSLDKGLSNKYDFNEKTLMDKTPYLECVYNAEYGYDASRGTKHEYTPVSNLTGYQELTLIQFSSTTMITKEEKDMILSLCEKGIVL